MLFDEKKERKKYLSGYFLDDRQSHVKGKETLLVPIKPKRFMAPGVCTSIQKAELLAAITRAAGFHFTQV